jgi:hypothetical protein
MLCHDESSPVGRTAAPCVSMESPGMGGSLAACRAAEKLRFQPLARVGLPRPTSPVSLDWVWTVRREDCVGVVLRSNSFELVLISQA